MLKHLLIKHLAFVLLWTFQILIQIIAILDLDDALMICGFDVKHMSLKMCVNWMIDLITLELIEMLVSSIT